MRVIYARKLIDPIDWIINILISALTYESVLLSFSNNQGTELTQKIALALESASNSNDIIW